MKLSHLAQFLFITASLVASLPALGGDTPTTLTGANLVNADKAKQLIDSGTPVFDVRVANEFADSHVKGAVNVTYKEKSAKAPDFNAVDDSFDLSKLPADKNAMVIFYCNGPECWKSYKASKTAALAGYKKVQWFRGGFPEWKSKGYPVE